MLSPFAVTTYKSALETRATSHGIQMSEPHWKSLAKYV